MAAVMIFLLAGCVAPDPRPFQQYAAAVKQAGDGLDQILVQDIGWSRDKYITNLLEGSVTLRDTAILDRKAPFSVTFPVVGGVTTQPTFYKLQDIRITLLALNDATEKYISVLVTLAGSDFVNPATFDAIAKDADASLNSVNKQLNAQVPGMAIHVFSLSGAEIGRLIIEHKRHDALVKVLTDSQVGIDGYCERCVRLLTILDQSLATDYSAKADALEGVFSTTPKANRATDPKARAAVEQLLQLNSDYLALVHSLQSAKKIYGALPQGHGELLKSVQKQPTGFEAIKGIYEEGMHLKSIYDELNKPTATKG
jgi:hypothetical protein